MNNISVTSKMLWPLAAAAVATAAAVAAAACLAGGGGWAMWRGPPALRAYKIYAGCLTLQQLLDYSCSYSQYVHSSLPYYCCCSFYRGGAHCSCTYAGARDPRRHFLFLKMPAMSRSVPIFFDLYIYNIWGTMISGNDGNFLLRSKIYLYTK